MTNRYSASPCYGSCPAFQLEIKSNGNIKFQGRIYSKQKGDFIGVIEADDLALIAKHVDLIDWKKLKRKYWEDVSDSQYFNIEMEDSKGKKYMLTTNSPKLKAINILMFHAFRIVENSALENAESDLKFSTGG